MADSEHRAPGLGLVQVYTGDGKGKTTAALGLALRAAGAGRRVYIGHFLKSRPGGEHESLRRLGPNVSVELLGSDGWVRGGRPTAEQREAARAALQKIRAAVTCGTYDLVIADEIAVAVTYGLVTENEVIGLIEAKSAHTELVLTGRQASAAVLERADLVTEMREVRHPYARGLPARRGIEF